MHASVLLVAAAGSIRLSARLPVCLILGNTLSQELLGGEFDLDSRMK